MKRRGRSVDNGGWRARLPCPPCFQCAFLIIVGFPAGTSDVRRRRPRQSPLSRRNTRRCTRPRATSTHAPLFQEAGPLIPLPSQGNHPLRCIQAATALQFDCHQRPSSTSSTFKETTIVNHVAGIWSNVVCFLYLSTWFSYYSIRVECYK